MSDTKPPRQHDEALPGLGDVAATTTNAGYLQRHVAAAIVAAELDDRDKGMAHYRRDPYAVAAAARELRETLVRLRMDPASRLGNDAGQVETWLESLQAD
jgi:hypothetical protein